MTAVWLAWLRCHSSCYKGFSLSELCCLKPRPVRALRASAKSRTAEHFKMLYPPRIARKTRSHMRYLNSHLKGQLETALLFEDICSVFTSNVKDYYHRKRWDDRAKHYPFLFSHHFSTHLPTLQHSVFLLYLKHSDLSFFLCEAWEGNLILYRRRW